MQRFTHTLTILFASVLTLSQTSFAHGISAKKGNAKDASFDIIKANVTKEKDSLVFNMSVSASAGATKPAKTGALAGASVFSYVWPTSLDSSSVGFEPNQGILALAVTAHPDFDDTPIADENGDGKNDNDGDVWHSHWVVLVKDDACGVGALKVKDIPEGTKPKLPVTWPNLPIFIDSPGFLPLVSGSKITVRVPLSALGSLQPFKFDGVTAGLRVNASVHAPLLCVKDVFDIASGDLSLPGNLKASKAKAKK